jgi:hypothetical protein
LGGYSLVQKATLRSSATAILLVACAERATPHAALVK